LNFMIKQMVNEDEHLWKPNCRPAGAENVFCVRL